MFSLSGIVTGVGGVPASGLTVNYVVDGLTYATTTDAYGFYSFTMRGGNCVTIRVVTNGVGVTVTPPERTVCGICSDMGSLDFTLSAVGPGAAVISGTVSGLVNNAGIPIMYSVGGQNGTTYTDVNGNYSINAPIGSEVIITATAQTGYTFVPTNYLISQVAGNTPNQNFVYSPV